MIERPDWLDDDLLLIVMEETGIEDEEEAIAFAVDIGERASLFGPWDRPEED